MKICLTKDSMLSPEHAILLNKIALGIRHSYVSWINELAQGHEDDIDWWVSELASRNTYTNSLFTWCCYILLIKRILETEETIEEVIVDSPVLHRVLKRYCRQNNIKVIITCSSGWKEWTNIIPKIPFYYFRYLWEYIVARFFLPQPCKYPSGGLTLIDTFVFDNSFNNGEYQDRYYGRFGGFLNAEELRSVFYLPTMENSWKHTFKIFREMRSAKQNLILKEDFLKISDYLYAFLYPFRAIKLFPKQIKFEGLDVTPLFRSVWFRYLTNASSVEGLLKFRLARRLKQYGVRIRLIIDWFENQSVDKGANAGFRKYYPETPIVGYQGYIIPKHYLAMYPTQKEHDSCVIPHKIAVCGKGFEEERKEFCADLDIITAPAFRFAGVWKDRIYQPDATYTTLLVALHLTDVNSIDVLRAAISVSTLPLPANTRFWLKPHPAAGPIERLLEQTGLNLPPQFEVVQGDFTKIVEQSDILISNTSSTCIESLTKGIPVIIIGSRCNLTQNPIPDSVPSNLWRLCYTPQDVLGAIQYFIKSDERLKKEYLELGEVIREEYFEPVTNESVRKFLTLEYIKGR